MARFEQEWEADQDVLRSLAENGDLPEIVRTVDVSFCGTAEALVQIADNAEQLGFFVLEGEPTDGGDPWLFLGRNQPADADAIRALTLVCLQIEAAYDVEYNGWGCVAQTGTTH